MALTAYLPFVVIFTSWVSLRYLRLFCPGMKSCIPVLLEFTFEVLHLFLKGVNLINHALYCLCLGIRYAGDALLVLVNITFLVNYSPGNSHHRGIMRDVLHHYGAGADLGVRRHRWADFVP